MKIDYVFPWVNPLDKVWVDSYKSTFGDSKFDPARFRDLGLLRYVFRSIEKNAPWINNVYLILACPTQLPNWLNTENVKIVYHDQFIPQEYLPVFNSAAIEQFLPNIVGLEEHFIYGNDDFYFNAPTQELDFFDIHGNPKLSFKEKSEIETNFDYTCRNCYDIVKNDFPHELSDFFKPTHVPTPMLLSTLRKVQELHKDEMRNHYNVKRNVLTDINQYIFTDYQILSGNYTRIEPIGKYIQLDRGINEVLGAIKAPSKLLCINDTEHTIIGNLPKVRGAFYEKYPNKSKFEN